MIQSVRHALRRSAKTASALGSKKSFHSSPQPKGGHDGPAYEHAEHMYDVRSISNRGLKFGLGIFGGLALGSAIPVIAVKFQQAKAQG
jgi:hypothetical protein